MPRRRCSDSGGSGGGVAARLKSHPGRFAAGMATSAFLLAALLLWPGSCAPSLPCCLLSSGGILPRQPGPVVELVVAHYAGNLSFVPGLLAQLGSGTQLTLYSKSSQPPPGEEGTVCMAAAYLCHPCNVLLMPPNRSARLPCITCPPLSRYHHQQQERSSCPTWGGRGTPSWPTCTPATTHWQR